MPLTLEEARWHIASCLMYPQLSVSARTDGRRKALANVMLGTVKSIDVIKGYIEKSSEQDAIEYWEGFLDVWGMNPDDLTALRGE